MFRRSVIAATIAAAMFGGGLVAALDNPSWLLGLFGGSDRSNTLLVSGNIEAHESMLGFKTVQSRIVELPFDEGASVREGAVVARVDDSDYRKQVDIARATLEVQKRQLATAEQNVLAAKQTVESDRADLEFKKTDAERYQIGRA